MIISDIPLLWCSVVEGLESELEALHREVEEETGLSDSYRDISLLIRELYDYEDSIEQDSLKNIIKDIYDIENIDEEKVKYFVMMDEFF